MTDRVENVDVIVVGGGGAGMMAAWEARKYRRNVVLLEKTGALGGATVWSIGSISATCSQAQHAAGIDDDPQSHFEDMEGFHGTLAGRDNPELRRVLVENVPETLRLLTQMGLVFLGPMPEPPHRMPRMHNVLPNSRAYGYQLGRAVRRAGVRVKLGSSAQELLLDDGVVRGVRAKDPDGDLVDYKARHGVVLAAGDYSASRQLKAEYAGAMVADIQPVVRSSTGDGYRLGLSAGGVMVNGDLLGGPQIRFAAPPRNIVQMIPPYRFVAQVLRWSMQTMPKAVLRPFIMKFVTTVLEPQKGLFEAGAILLNNRGERFCDECDKPQYAIHTQPDGKAYIVLDKALTRQFSAWPHFVSTAPGVAYAYMKDYRRNRPDVYTVAENARELAKKLNMPLSNLEASLKGGPRKPLGPGPYHVLGPVESWIVITDGGLRVTSRHEVVRADGSPIEGLYAAGSNGQGGLLLEGHGHHLGWAFTSGRLAGRNAAFFASRARSSQPLSGS